MSTLDRGSPTCPYCGNYPFKHIDVDGTRIEGVSVAVCCTQMIVSVYSILSEADAGSRPEFPKLGPP